MLLNKSIEGRRYVKTRLLSLASEVKVSFSFLVIYFDSKFAGQDGPCLTFESTRLKRSLGLGHWTVTSPLPLQEGAL